MSAKGSWGHHREAAMGHITVWEDAVMVHPLCC